MNKINKRGFTFVEIIVASTVFILIATIGFYSFSKDALDARDAERKSDIENVKSALMLYKKQRGSYPLPADKFDITNNGITVAHQGKLNTYMRLPPLDIIPLDPTTNNPYSYAITYNRQEYQVATTLENNGENIALVDGDYKSSSKGILPSLFIAIESKNSVDISLSENKERFIINGNNINLPYDLETGKAFHNNTAIIDFKNFIENPNNSFIQNTSFRSCEEIEEAEKDVGDGNYEILDSKGDIISTYCTF